MKKQHIIQLLQYLLARVGVWLFVVFVMEKSFIEFVLQYWVFLLVVSVSYFYYYSIQYEVDKKYNTIRFLLLYWNLYLFAHIFFRPLLNISHELFILLWLIILWLWWIVKMKSRRKGILQVLWWIFAFFILISWIFYLFPEEPDITWFLMSRDYEIKAYNISENIPKIEAYVRISWNTKNEDFIIWPKFYQKITSDCSIAYPSSEEYRQERIILTTPEWEVVQLFPQSELQVEFSEENMINLYARNWRIWFLTWLFTSSTEFFWEENVFSEEDLLWIKWLQDEYNIHLVSYLKNQISDNDMGLINNRIMYKIDGMIIKFLCLIFPTSYTKNLHNYQEFQNYFSLVSEDNFEFVSYWKQQESLSINSLWENMKKNMGIGKENLYDIFTDYKNQ